MRIIKDLAEITEPLRNAVVTVGNFDGVHLGHREIFRRVKSTAADSGGVSVVVTFIPHPLKVLAPEKSPRLINTYAEKETLIEACGLDYLVEIPFDRRFAAMPARDFVAEVLVGKLGMKTLIIGYDYAFGRNREGNVSLLTLLGDEFSFKVEELKPISNGSTVFSSTAIRKMIAAGDVKGVVPLLGRHFSVGGTVVHGHHRGKGLGFPTANLETEKELLPKDGVYAVKVKVDDVFYDGACNIGTNPTFRDEGLSVEVFLFDFEGDIYCKGVRAYFIDRVRDEKTFADVTALQQAIADDIQRCRDILSKAFVIEYDEYLKG
ncbi:bifunctional riboflavin kinase/FAD synthetase [Geotalea sp. SG265]|uniref:bifunctional riboflavin kinase/FAD synthetase n=1 Tax=Geotalea sp. SG265 TaxID=2922867 RepID=UPI001FAF9610|nr:bifunctional riboflavin kinase/FAD synthetase [Geotalea sp. SG265]